MLAALILDTLNNELPLVRQKLRLSTDAGCYWCNKGKNPRAREAGLANASMESSMNLMQ